MKKSPSPLGKSKRNPTFHHAAAITVLFAISTILLVAGCEKKAGETAGGSSSSSGVSGTVMIDGSSTVAPITKAAAELFEAETPGVKVTVGVSGTGGGFKKFLAEQADLRTDINDASRPIKPSEMDKAKALGIEFIEMPIGIDGIAVMVHPTNTFCDHLTVEELKRIWEPGSQINNWKHVREGFPDLPLKLYGPGTDSGTFDYFTEAINGEEKASRSDYTASETDNMLVVGISGDEGGLGYFGFSYFEANKDKLKLVGVDNGSGPVKPNLDIIRAGTYKPLSRPLFLYVNKSSAERPEIKAFFHFFFDNARSIVEHPRVNYVALSDELYAASRKRFDNQTTGSVMAQNHSQTTDLTDLYVRE